MDEDTKLTHGLPVDQIAAELNLNPSEIRATLGIELRRVDDRIRRAATPVYRKTR